MKYFLFILFFLIIYIVPLNATQFVPLSIEAQVKDADLAVEATLEKQKFYKNLNGSITGEYTFVVHEGFGFSGNEIKLDLPGGTLDGVTTLIEGAPVFKEKINYFLLLKKIESKMYLSNYTMGEYQVVTIDNKEFYRSLAFSHDPQIGMIAKEKMKILLASKLAEVTKKIDSIAPATNIPLQISSNLNESSGIKKNVTTPANQQNQLIKYLLILVVFIAICGGLFKAAFIRKK